MSLKPLVNNKELWDTFKVELKQSIELAHKNMETCKELEEIYRLQGEIRALRKLEYLREKVNNAG